MNTDEHGFIGRKKTQRGVAATKNNFIRKPGNQEGFPLVLGFLVSL
jgi:hypothetical protein